MKNAGVIVILISFVLQAENIRSKTLLERLAEPKVILNASYLNNAKVENSEGSVEVVKNRLMINNAFMGLSYTNWNFRWANVEDLPFGDGQHQPIEKMHGLSLDARVPYPVNDQWFTLSSISVRATFEKEVQDSLSISLFSFASYKASDAHTFQIGVFANYHPVSTLVLPALSYSYRARMRDGIQAVLGFPRSYVGYHATPSALIRLSGIYSQSVIRLSDESTIAPGGFIEAQDYMGSLGLTYVLDKDIELQGDLLYAFRRDFISYDQDGRQLDAYGIEPSLGVSLKLVCLL